MRFVAVLTILLSSLIPVARAQVSPEGQACLDCHSNTTPGIVEQWRDSAHAKKNVDCYSCHRADEKDPATFDHYGHRIAVIVTPNYCARCHSKEVDQFEKSHHAQATQFIGSLDNMLGEFVEGGPAAVNGCRQCHGSEVMYLKDGKFDPDTWPNSGIGRVNPDGSRGTCAACHGRHSFSSALARQPENCGKCHLGPDHPQIEIYNESKHGIQFRANIAKMNLASTSWVVGKDYSAAPTCATCHMSATSNQPVTHDVGDRISFTLRPVISVKLENWEKRRAAMQDVCSNCHATGWVENFYRQYENTVDLYNEKFAKPAKGIMDKLYAASKLTKTPFDEKIEWTYYELWHHQGRRARMGTAMMGPDYTQWHGFYEVAKTFYTEFIPEAEALLPGVTSDVMNSPYHRWTQGLSKEQLQQQLDFYKKRYNQWPQRAWLVLNITNFVDRLEEEMEPATKVTVYEKPTWTKCREVKRVFTEKGIEFESVDYMKQKSLSANELKHLLRSARLKPRDALRTNEAAYHKYVANRTLSDEQLIRVMAEHPELIQRPIVMRGNRAVLARPVDNLAELGIQ